MAEGPVTPLQVYRRTIYSRETRGYRAAGHCTRWWGWQGVAKGRQGWLGVARGGKGDEGGLGVLSGVFLPSLLSGGSFKEALQSTVFDNSVPL